MSSPEQERLESLSTSNLPPSAQDLSIAERFAQLYHQKLKVVDARITALEQELDELKAQRLVLEGERRRYADIASARRLLPPEIIAQFMELACVDGDTFPGTYQQILSFMLVSREWYRTACSVAHFWTELEMDLTKSSVEDTQHIIRIANRRSTRAAKLPLSLKVAFSAAAPTSTQVVGFIHTLKPRLGTLDLHIYVDSSPDLQILDPLLHPQLSSSILVWPMLHTLQVSVQLKPDSEGFKAASRLFIPSASFPLLRTAAVSSPNVAFPSCQMPWSDLLRLDLGPFRECEMRQYVQILGECTNLQSLCLRMQSKNGDVESMDNLTIPTLPNLTHLQLENNDPQVRRMGKLLSLLKLPSLQSCTYTVLEGGGYYTPIVRQLAELFQRSGCSESMEYLELNLSLGLSHSPGTLGNLFRQVPRLTVLKLSGSKMEMGALVEVPCGVRDLSVELGYHRVDIARAAFTEYLNTRFASSNDVPLKARLHVVDTSLTAPIRERLDILKNDFGGSLDVVMD